MFSSDSVSRESAVSSRTIADQILFLRNQVGVHTTTMHVIKLVYICHGWMLGIHSRKLCYEPAEAWRYGPVIPNVYYTFKAFGGLPIDIEPQDSSAKFDDYQNALIEEVLDKYQNYSGLELSSVAHKAGTPWCQVYNNGRGLGAIIPDRLIQKYYEQLAYK